MTLVNETQREEELGILLVESNEGTFNIHYLGFYVSTYVDVCVYICMPGVHGYYGPNIVNNLSKGFHAFACQTPEQVFGSFHANH